MCENALDYVVEFKPRYINCDCERFSLPWRGKTLGRLVFDLMLPLFILWRRRKKREEVERHGSILAGSEEKSDSMR